MINLQNQSTDSKQIIKTDNEQLHEILQSLRAKSKGRRKPAVLESDELGMTCPICKNKGFILTAEGAVPCKCYPERRARAQLIRAGVDVEEFAKLTLASFPKDTPEARKMYDMAVRYINHRKPGQSIAYTGKSGTMKTSICISICQELARRGEEYTYFQYRAEIQNLKSIMYTEQYSERIKYFIKCPNLFIDDFLKFAEAKKPFRSNKSEIQGQDLQICFDIINGRYLNKKSTIFSSEYSFSRVMQEIDEALGSRLLQMCEGYGMSCAGENRRLN